MPSDRTKGLEVQSRRLRRFTSLIAILLAGIICASVAAALRAAGSPAAPLDRSELLVAQALFWLPSFFYLWALLAIRAIFGNLARGATFEPAVAKGLQHVGLAMIGGAATSAVVVPNLTRIVIQTGLVRGETRPFQGILHFDLAYLVLGVVGLALILLARLLGRAAELQAEAQALRSELDEFL